MTNRETLHRGTCGCDRNVAYRHRRYAPEIHSFTLARTGDAMANIVLDYRKKAYRRAETLTAVIDDRGSYQGQARAHGPARGRREGDAPPLVDQLPRDQAKVLRLRSSKT